MNFENRLLALLTAALFGTTLMACQRHEDQASASKDSPAAMANNDAAGNKPPADNATNPPGTPQGAPGSAPAAPGGTTPGQSPDSQSPGSPSTQPSGQSTGNTPSEPPARN